MHTGRRLFDWGSHELFAQVSSDFNPIHIDPVLARRTYVGAPVVHGIHTLIWALDCFAQNEAAAASVKGLKVQFLQPVYVGDEVNLRISEAGREAVRLQVAVGSEEVLVATLTKSGFNQSFVPTLQQSQTMAPPEKPLSFGLEQMQSLSGALSFGPKSSQIAALYPSAVARFGARRIESLASSSCLVGMVVPGLHSMFSGLEVSFCEDSPGAASEIQFAVLSVIKRFRLIHIGIRGPGLAGSLDAVNRTGPVPQSSMSHLKGVVAEDEFNGSAALIIGGSRGLGEITGKLIAAGGGEVAITYSVGKADAESLVSDMRAAGAECSALAYDVRRNATDQLGALGVIPTHLYYFATPLIFRRKAGIFDVHRFSEFNLFYLTAFFNLVQACIKIRPAGIRVFYPSTSFLDARPANMTEYSMSKAAAEVLCADMSKFIPGVKVLSRRLPRLPTDQTSSLVTVKTADPVEVMLSIVREMHC